MKNILFILYFIIYSCAPAFGAATTTITADSIRSSNRTKTWTPPSITDTLTGLTDVQTLTNKTLTSPTINTPLVDVDTFTEQGSTPSTPAAGKRKVYAKADGIYHLDSAGNERKVGSGAGGGDVSYIVNGSADDANASIFVPYADAAGTRPVDGTGGSPTVTTSITSTTPLVGTKSFLLTKPASNVQGQGWAIPFTVDLGYRAKASKISVQYIVNSGTFNAASAGGIVSDVVWYLYDVTNSVLIEPTNFNMFSNSSTISDTFQAEFQTSATGSSYRLIAHIASINPTAYELKVDEIKITPNKAIYSNTITEWTSYTTSCSGSWATNATYSCKKRKVGDSYEYDVLVTTTGAPTAANLTINIPDTIDTAKLNSVAGDVTMLGIAKSLDIGTAAYGVGSVRYLTTTSVSVTTQNSSGTFGTEPLVSNTVPFTFGSGDTVHLLFRAPILGLTLSQKISDGYDGRDISLSATRSSAAITANTAIGSWTTVRDSTGSFNSSTGVFDVPSFGNYTVNWTSILPTSGSTGPNIYLNGVSVAAGPSAVAGSTRGSVSAVIVGAKAGDAITFVGDTSCTLDATSKISIVKNQSPQTISASEIIKSTITQTSGQSIPSTTNTKIVGAVESDTHGIYNVGTSEWIQSRSGKGKISGQFHISIGATTSTIASSIYKNGNLYKQKYITVVGVENNYPIEFNSETDGVAGDKWDIRVNQNTGSSRSIVSDATFNQVTFQMDN